MKVLHMKLEPHEYVHISIWNSAKDGVTTEPSPHQQRERQSEPLDFRSHALSIHTKLRATRRVVENSEILCFRANPGGARG